MNRACDYAACTLLATAEADGWHFCREHLREHLVLVADGDTTDPRMPQRRWRPKTEVDPVSVDRAVAGWPHDRLSRAERLLAVQRLRDQGLGSKTIAKRLGIHRRQADRDLSDLRAQQAEAS